MQIFFKEQVSVLLPAIVSYDLPHFQSEYRNRIGKLVTKQPRDLASSPHEAISCPSPENASCATPPVWWHAGGPAPSLGTAATSLRYSSTQLEVPGLSLAAAASPSRDRSFSLQRLSLRHTHSHLLTTTMWHPVKNMKIQYPRYDEMMTQ